MADSITEGFGATPIVSIAAGETLVRLINAPPQGIARITLIKITALTAGAPPATAFAPVVVLRAPASFGVVQAAGLAVPAQVRFTTGFGIPVAADLTGPIEYLDGNFIRYQNQQIPLVYKDVDLIATNSSKLVVVVNPLVDATAAPALVTCTYSLTVLGDVGNISRESDVLGGSGRSLPKWDV